MRTDHTGNVDSLVLDDLGELEGLRGELDRYRSVFDSARLIVGHEFNKPLTSIRGYIELLENRLGERAGEDGRKYFAKAREAVIQLEELVESFVQMLRFDYRADRAGECESVILRELVEGLRPRYAGHRGRLRNAVEPDMPPVYLQRKPLEVILDNLVSNAMKHSGDSAAVTVTAEMLSERRGPTGGEILIVTVEDGGVGIPEEELEDIFNPFYRVDSGEISGGLGLGLALVKNIVTLMKGEIHVRSRPGEGTAVTFSMPVTLFKSSSCTETE
jgi:signal transduction histidine kinase